MPQGRYDLLDPDGAVLGSEDFRCAPGPMGWRYFSTVSSPDGMTRVDVSVDAEWRPVRVRIENERAHLIGTRAQGGMTFVLDDERIDVPDAARVWYPSPGFDVVAARSAPDGWSGDAIVIDPQTLRPAVHRIAVRPAEPEGQIATPVGAFDARPWTIGGRSVWLSGDVAVAYERGWSLAAYDRGAAGPTPKPLRTI